ncbi:MAG: hypothetical protein WDZ51_14345 [Pirellulaceae bacterium]
MNVFSLSALISFFLLVPLVGCGNSSTPRESVSGTVTLEGQPLVDGSILFSPQGDGPSAGGEIVNGQYTLARELGPAPGKYRVEISSWRSTGKSIYDAASEREEETLVSVIPPRYNSRSELQVEIEPGKENRFDFELMPK